MPNALHAHHVRMAILLVTEFVLTAGMELYSQRKKFVKLKLTPDAFLALPAKTITLKMQAMYAPSAEMG